MARDRAGTFGALLRRHRQSAAFTQAALAERAGLSTGAVSALERGTRQVPYLGTVELLAMALALGEAARADLLAAARPEGAALFSADTLVPLVGRQRELALLGRFLGAQRGPLESARLLLLTGEPGIGKTRLLQAAAQQAIAQGWCVLVGGCQRRGGQEPHAPLLDALAQHLQTMDPAQLRATLSGCSWLVHLLPEVAWAVDLLPDVTLAPEQERRLIHAAVARLLRNVAGPAGTLLVLDDLQWAGPDALDLIDTLARTTAARIVGAYRDTEVRPADPLGLLLADLAQARLARQHTLGPLDAQEAEALLAELLVDIAGRDRILVERVLRRAGGTPFFLVSYAQALYTGATEAVPWDLAQGVRQRVALLTAAGQDLLGVAAIVGRRAPRALLVAAAGQPEEAVLAGLEAACRARLLLEEGDDAYAFAHDVIREVVEADVGAARRAVLHRKVAEALEGEPGAASPELLAYHYTRGGDRDKAVRYLELAGDLAAGARAYGAAEGRYGEALADLEGLGRVQDAPRMREKLGKVLVSIGRYEAALGVFEGAAEGYTVAGDLEGLARVTVAIGISPALVPTTFAGIARITALLDRLERGGTAPPPLAPLYEALGLRLFTAGEYKASLAASERAATLARACGDERTLARAERNRINTLQMLGRLGEALRLGETALPLVEAVGDPQRLVWVLTDLAYIHLLRGTLATSRRYIERALALAGGLENPADLSFVLGIGGWLAVLSGEWPRARADLERAVSASSQNDRSWYSSYPPIFLARLSLAQGDLVAAGTSVRDALALARASGDLQALRWAAATMAEIEILEGLPEAARDRLLPLLDRTGLQECDVTMLLPVLAWAQLESGRTDLATDAVDQALRRARPEQMRLVLVESLRVHAMVALRRGRWDEAARSLEEGLALARSMPCPGAEARLLQVHECLHALRGGSGVVGEGHSSPQARLHRPHGLPARISLDGAAASQVPGHMHAAVAPVGQDRTIAGERGAGVRPNANEPAAVVLAPRRRSQEERATWVLDYLRTIGPISPRLYGTATGMDRRTALRDLQALVERGLIVAQGTTRDRRYAAPGAEA